MVKLVKFCIYNSYMKGILNTCYNYKHVYKIENQKNSHKRLAFVDERRTNTGSQKARVIVWRKRVDREWEKTCFKKVTSTVVEAVKRCSHCRGSCKYPIWWINKHRHHPFLVAFDSFKSLNGILLENWSLSRLDFHQSSSKFGWKMASFYKELGWINRLK